MVIDRHLNSLILEKLDAKVPERWEAIRTEEGNLREEALQPFAEELATRGPAIQQAVVEVHDEEGRLDAVLQLLAQHGLHTVMERDHAIGGTNCTVYARR